MMMVVKLSKEHMDGWMEKNISLMFQDETNDC